MLSIISGIFGFNYFTLTKPLESIWFLDRWIIRRYSSANEWF